MSLILDHVNHIYGEGTGQAVAALKDINLVVGDGQFIGLIGHTGSGKSTLVQHLMMGYVPTSVHSFTSIWHLHLRMDLL